MKIKLLAFLLISVACISISAQTPFATIDKTSKFEKLNFFNPLTGNTNNQTNLRRYATNANRPGVIQIGVGWGSVIGGASLIEDFTGFIDTTSTFDDEFSTTQTQQGAGITSNFGLRMQCGVSEVVSLGFYVRKDMGSYVAKFDKFSISGLGFGLEGKIYPINKDMFAVYVAPSAGYSFATTKVDKHPGKAAGLNYGLTAGLNWYWTEGFGMSLDVGYVGSSMLGVYDSIKLAGLDYKINYSGLYIGAGLVVKFDAINYN